MLRVQGNARSAARAAWRLPCLFFALAAAGVAVAQQAKAPPGVDQQYAPAHANRTTYRVVNLGSGPLGTLPKINAKGQVVFSINADPAPRGYFYNGRAVQDIGTLGGEYTLANDLNNAGQVAGSSTLANGSEHAFVWSAGGGMLDLGVVPGAYNSRAHAINNLGVVTGVSEAFDFVHALRWSATDGIEDLGAFTTGFGFSNGTALNDAGLIVGNSDTPDNETQIFSWTRATGMVNIDTLDSRYSDAVAVNAKGEVAGGRIPAGDTLLYRAYIWTPRDGTLDLGTGGGVESFSMAINARGQVPVLVNYADETQRSMSWTRSGGMRDIGTLGGRWARAIALNNKGQLVGYSDNTAGEGRAFVWSAGTGMIDLNTRLRHAPPGLLLDDALAINDSGAIVATSNAGLVLLKPGHGGKDGHAVGPIKASELVKAGTPLRASVAWVDEDRVGTRSINWSWGDGTGGASKMRELDGVGSASASHSYAAPGIYPLTVTLVDREGRSTAVRRDVVVAAPGGVAGSGALMSPPGAYAKSPPHAAKARFSLVGPGADGARTTGGQGRLQFDLPGLNLRSDNLRLIGRQGGQHVFEGSGTIGGAGDYRFRLAATAGVQRGHAGRFGIRIWRTDPVTKAETVVYDNQRAGRVTGALVEGSIVGKAE